MPRRGGLISRITVSAPLASICRISAARTGTGARRCLIAVSESLRRIGGITVIANRTGIDSIASRRTRRQCNFRNISMPLRARMYRRDRISRSIPRFVRRTKIEKSLCLCGLNVCSRCVYFPYRGRRRSVFEFTHAAAAVHRRKAEFLFRRTARCNRVPVLQ